MFVVAVLAVSAQDCRFFMAGSDLTSSMITDICQDADGMLWIGTEDGLNRFDGASFSSLLP